MLCYGCAKYDGGTWQISGMQAGWHSMRCFAAVVQMRGWQTSREVDNLDLSLEAELDLK